MKIQLQTNIVSKCFESCAIIKASETNFEAVILDTGIFSKLSHVECIDIVRHPQNYCSEQEVTNAIEYRDSSTV